MLRGEDKVLQESLALMASAHATERELAAPPDPASPSAAPGLRPRGRLSDASQAGGPHPGTVCAVPRARVRFW